MVLFGQGSVKLELHRFGKERWGMVLRAKRSIKLELHWLSKER